MKKAVIYARFSSDNQREESIDAQVRAIEEYAERNNIIITNCYIDEASTPKSILKYYRINFNIIRLKPECLKLVS